MPLPPILEIFVVWHPDDGKCGEFVSNTLMEHFHSATFSGLAGGAVEVYNRSAGWRRTDGAPRPLAITEPWPYELPEAQFTAVVPILGAGMDRAFLSDPGWRSYVRSIFDADSTALGVFPVRDPEARLTGLEFIKTVRRPQALHENSATDKSVLCLELSQAIAQHLSSKRGDRGRIKVFVSHTKHVTLETKSSGSPPFEQVRQVIDGTHLDTFFDAADLQPGTDWEEQLDAEAGRCALLMVRTDEYAGREWTQREVHAAKVRDVPIVGLYALHNGEERGSFLMDHVPTVACNLDDPKPGIAKSLNRVVDEVLKSELWRFQSVYLRKNGFDWTPVHSPEPVTTAPWLQTHKALEQDNDRVRIIHPDPPLGPRENQVLLDMCELAGFKGEVEILTPRTFAARGGESVVTTEDDLVARDALTGVNVALSVSDSQDLHRLGLMRSHCNLAVAEVARAVFLAGGSITYGGWLKAGGFTQVLMDEVLRYSDNRQALTICVPWSEHIGLPLRDIEAMDKRLGSSARVMLMNPQGNAMTVGDTVRGGRDESFSMEPPRALSAMRKHVTESTQARVVVGGKLSGFEGDMPGVIEEALLSLAAHQPLYVAAGYGGASAAIARTLGHDDLGWGPPDFPRGAEDSKAASALEKLAQYTSNDMVADGLSDLQRWQLAATHRPGTIAAILVQGLARQLS